MNQTKNITSRIIEASKTTCLKSAKDFFEVSSCKLEDCDLLFLAVPRINSLNMVEKNQSKFPVLDSQNEKYEICVGKA